MNEIASMIVSALPFVGNVVNVNVHVADEFSAPISNALVQVCTHESNGDRFARSPRYKTLERRSDAHGNARFTFTSVSGDIRCMATAEGYYPERDNKQRFASTYSDFTKVVLSEYSKDISFTLRRKKNPAALFYAKPSFSLKLPSPSGEFGFDLQMNDWIVPHGGGKVADFYVQREASPTNSKVTVNSGIVFRGDGNGAYIRRKVKTTSDFKTDHEADTNGIYQAYLPLLRFPNPRNPVYTSSAIVKEDEYIVMRTRVKKDEKGNIVKANYSAMLGTVNGDDYLDCLGYVFNPTPNDPNLEMDLKRSTDLEYAKRKWKSSSKRKPYAAVPSARTPNKTNQPQP